MNRRALVCALAFTPAAIVAAAHAAAPAAPAATPAQRTPAATATDPTADITALLTAQTDAWNRGDIDTFMATYAHTDALRFASADHVTYGWQATRDRYHERYPDRAAMGHLTFSDLDVTRLADDAAIVFGRWQLTRTADAPHGLFTLTVRKTPDGWRIFQDHTSSALP